MGAATEPRIRRAAGSVLIYSSRRDMGSIPGTVQHHGVYDAQGRWISFGDSYTAPEDLSYERTRMFYVNERGIIYSWRWKGL